MKHLPEKVTRKVLLALPVRQWDTNSVYDSLFLVPTGNKHDSGFSVIAIVGVINKKAEIAAYCDDVCWTFPKEHPHGRMEAGKNRMILRTDCYWPSGIMRMWGSGEHYFKGLFRVGMALSSTDVELFVAPVGDGKNKATGEVVSL